MNRRAFLAGTLGVAAAGAGGVLLRRQLFDNEADAPARVYGELELRRRKAPRDAPNVLFVSIDDLNDWLGFLNNHPGTHTPNLDALAAASLSFDHAYTPAPMCLPARSAILYGRHPFRTQIYDHSDASRDAHTRFAAVTPSIVDDFWAAGYDTFGTGKVFHDPQAARWTAFRRFPWYIPGYVRKREDSDPRGYDPNWLSPYDGQPIGRGENFSAAMIDFGPSGKDASEEADGLATRWARDRLVEDHERPFFLALGLYLPHEPWRVPAEYFDLHPLDEVVVPEVRPDDLDDLGTYARDEIIDRFRAFERLVGSGLWEEAVQAYQAAISYADDHVGQILDQLASTPYADNTIVVVWSDHGFHLGEKMHIHKFTLWERATRVPLLVHVPGRFDRAQRFDPPVSTIDLGPTLAELCGVEIHGSHDGESLLSLVEDPERAQARPPVTTWLARNHSVRRGPWRYIRYRTGETELYDLRVDPNEFDNLAGDRRLAATVAELDAFVPPT